MNVNSLRTANDVAKLEYFLIKDLYGRQDINLIFAGSSTIFIADNGSGKTTALYMLKVVLSGHLAFLERFQYNSITIKIANEPPITITPKDYEISKVVGFLRKLLVRTHLTQRAIEDLARRTRNLPYEQLRDDRTLGLAARRMGIPTRILYNRMSSVLGRETDETDPFTLVEEPSVLLLRKLLKQHLNLQFFTFRPTAELSKALRILWTSMEVMRIQVTRISTSG